MSSGEPATEGEIARPHRLPGWSVSIKSTLAGLIAVMAVIAIGQAWFSLRQLSRMHDGLTSITGHSLPSVERADRVNIQINDVRSKQYRFFVTDESEIAQARENLARGLAALAAARGAYEAFIIDHEERRAYDRFSREWGRYSALWDRTDALLSAGQRDAALKLFKVEMWQVSNDAGAALDEVVDYVHRRSIKAADTAKEADRDARFATYVALGLALMIAGLAAIYVLNRIALPLSLITRALTRLATGDRGVVIPAVQRMDEIGLMAKAFDVFRANILELEEAHRAIRIAQEEAQALARHDALTGLPNRRLFATKLQDAVQRVEAGTGRCSVLLMDLDGFKPVNDRLSHAAGDSVLCEVARRLRGFSREPGIVARLGGDEFAIIAHHGGDAGGDRDELIALGRDVATSLREPIQVGATYVSIGASVGIASCPIDGADVETLLSAADLAMYRAKHDAPGSYKFFERSFDEEVRDRATVEADLRQAIAAREIQPFYQPIVDLARSRICGFEVLARWEHPARGFMSPDLFIPMAERLNVVAELTSSILRQACADARDWPGHLFLAVNVSAVELQDASLPTRIMAVLLDAGFPPSRLELEVTETALIHDRKTARTVMVALQTLGIKLALDDFGTGYSSLNHLVNLSFDKIKIDRSFVNAMRHDLQSGKVVDAVLGLAKNFGVSVVAEGIEDADVIARLRAGGCAYGQGYHFGKAVPAAEASALLSSAAPEDVRLDAVA